ncbi:MAG: hypothetical protein OER90_01620 [Gemmatimonadota bacterium]|nr:hypothetical protein [Gemmatimonadota bacterium]
MKPLLKVSVATAALLFVVAWLTPVHEYGTTLAQGGVPGWEAFRVALTPLWSFQDAMVETWYGSIHTVVSALTNFLFVAALAHMLWRPGTYGRAVCWLLVAATVINATWFLLDGDRGALRLGYYLWVSSFAVLATAAWFVPTSDPETSPQPQ